MRYLIHAKPEKSAWFRGLKSRLALRDCLEAMYTRLKGRLVLGGRAWPEKSTWFTKLRSRLALRDCLKAMYTKLKGRLAL
jgi:hypothetical protein